MSGVGYADEVARGLSVVLSSGFARKARKWSRVENRIESTVAVVRNPASFGLGEDICIETRVLLDNGRGYGFFRVDGTTTGGRNWWLKAQGSDDSIERRRIRKEIEEHVLGVALPWIEERATPARYLAHLRDERVPYRLIEACLAFGDDKLLAEVLARGPQSELPTGTANRELYATPAGAALRAYEHLQVPPSQEWSAHARAVLASYRGRPPKTERDIFEDLKARVAALAEEP